MTQADLTRERLVRAALELFTAHGYHETTTPQIAKKAGVAEGTIYRHFTSKQHCFNELYRTAARWAGQLVKDADALKVGPREKLAELARGLVTGAAHEAAVARLFFIQSHEDLLDEESRKTARDFRAGLGRALTNQHRRRRGLAERLRIFVAERDPGVRCAVARTARSPAA